MELQVFYDQYSLFHVKVGTNLRCHKNNRAIDVIAIMDIKHLNLHVNVESILCSML